MPRKLSLNKKYELLKNLAFQIESRLNFLNFDAKLNLNYKDEVIEIKQNDLLAIFQINKKKIIGNAFPSSIIVKDQLRRNGIRFRYEVVNNNWSSWT